MYYVLIDSTGNVIESLDDLNAARAAQQALVHQEPEAAEHVALLRYDEDGMPVGSAEMLLPREIGHMGQFLGETVADWREAASSPDRTTWHPPVVSPVEVSREESDRTSSDLKTSPA